MINQDLRGLGALKGVPSNPLPTNLLNPLGLPLSIRRFSGNGTIVKDRLDSGKQQPPEDDYLREAIF